MRRSDVLEWLAARRPERPEPLALEMLCSVESCPEGRLESAATMADALGVLGLSTLSLVTAGRLDGDGVALQLLAADAFVTYAFEAAADEGVRVGPLVERLLREAA